MIVLQTRKRSKYLRIIKLSLLTCFRSRGFASFFSRPRYVGLNSFQCTNTFPPSLSALKSYSQLTVLCSLPLGLFGKSSSFSIRVYFFPSDVLISNVMPSYSEKSQSRSSPVVRWDAKPAPPRVLVSRLPWKMASGEDGLQVSSE